MYVLYPKREKKHANRNSLFLDYDVGTAVIAEVLELKLGGSYRMLSNPTPLIHLTMVCVSWGSDIFGDLVLGRQTPIALLGIRLAVAVWC